MPLGELLFIDTSAFIALEDQGDENYAKAQAFKQEIAKRRYRLVTTNYIFDEVYTWFRKNHRVAIRVGESILDNPLVIYARISAEDEAAAWNLAKQYTDKGFSFTDCTSFVVMERLGITKVFAFDEHFHQIARFTVLPSS